MLRLALCAISALRCATNFTRAPREALRRCERRLSQSCQGQNQAGHFD